MDAPAGTRRGDAYRPGSGYGSPNPHRLYKNRANKVADGVCAGVADYLNVDPAWVRIGWAAGLFFFFPVFFFGYIALSVILKPRPGDLFENRAEEHFWRDVTTRPQQTVGALKSKFRELERDIETLEGYVASHEFDLNRQFRDLETK